MKHQPIDSTLHGVTDYQVGTFLMTAFPRVAGIKGTRAARQVRASGAAHVAYSVLTAYPLGLVKLIPYKAHLALDALGAAALAATPFVTGQWRKGLREWVPHVGLALFELGSLALTDPSGRGNYHGDVGAVREANMEDPRRKIEVGGVAVTPASAVGANGSG